MNETNITSPMLSIDTDESWTDGADSVSSYPRRDNNAQLRAIQRELEIMKVNIQMMLDTILRVVNNPAE